MESRSVRVEIVGARNLIAKNGANNDPASAYCTLDYEGTRRQTSNRPMGPTTRWGEEFKFIYFNHGFLEIRVYRERKGHTSRGAAGFLGKVKCKVAHGEKEGQEQWMPLEKQSLFSQTRGELGLKVWYEDPRPCWKPMAPRDVASSLELKPSLPRGEWPPLLPPLPQLISKEIDSKASEVVDGPKNIRDMFTVKEIARMNFDTAVDNRQSSDLLEPMPYLFVKVVRAQNLAARDAGRNGNHYVKISVGEFSAKTQVVKEDLHPSWERTFAFPKVKLFGPFLEISVWDAAADMAEADLFSGALSFLFDEIPSSAHGTDELSPLAPLWYKLEERPGRRIGVRGELMLALWMGTQADEAFQDAWQSDTGGFPSHVSRVYMSPTLWYLRVHVIEAENLPPVEPSDRSTAREPFVEIQLGNVQTRRFYVPTAKGVNPVWNKTDLFVTAEPFEEPLVITVKDRAGPDMEEIMGVVRIPLDVGAVSRRLDTRTDIVSWWFVLESGKEGLIAGRIHLRLVLEGGYHVSDEYPSFRSCTRPTAKELWKKPLGVLQLGIISAKQLLPMHNVAGGRGSTDAYCVAKYGSKWIRTRTISANFNPRWHEQYNWEVYDPCTVLTVCVFDSRNNINNSATSEKIPDCPMGKVRFRLSTLESGRAYFNSHPLLVVTASGVEKMGELECAVCFTGSSTIDVLKAYLRPPLPPMHYLSPINETDMNRLQIAAVKLIESRVARFHPPLRAEVVKYVLDNESCHWSLRRTKANYFRVASLLSVIFGALKWFEDICAWKNRATTVLVYAFFFIFVWFTWLFLPILFFCLFLLGLWNYRFRSGSPPSFDPLLSLGGEETIRDVDEFEEEFNVFSPDNEEGSFLVLRRRYERLKGFALRVQTFVGDTATQGERLHFLLKWLDPRATAIFVIFCFTAAVLLYVRPRIVAALLGVYLMRHPKFRSPLPALPLTFFRRLPSLSDTIL